MEDKQKKPEPPCVLPPYISTFAAYELKPGINTFKIDCNFYYQKGGKIYVI